MALWKGFQKPKRLATDTETLTNTYGRFWAQPFERGFGTTVGNALRRVLLSSIEGAAITAIRVEGVLHEFSPIPGAMEDTTDLILNLKRVPLKLHVDHPKTLILKTSEPGEVLVSSTVKDLVAGSGISFEDRGVHMLAGCGECRLFAVLKSL